MSNAQEKVLTMNALSSVMLFMLMSLWTQTTSVMSGISISLRYETEHCPDSHDAQSMMCTPVSLSKLVLPIVTIVCRINGPRRSVCRVPRLIHETHHNNAEQIKREVKCSAHRQLHTNNKIPQKPSEKRLPKYDPQSDRAIDL
jgi:hypothetical protein